MQILMIAFFFFFQSFLVKVQQQECKSPVASNIIYQSKDGGRTWQDISAGLPPKFNAQGVYTEEGKLILSFDKGLYRCNTNNSIPNWAPESFFDRPVSNVYKCNGGLFAHNFEDGFYQEIVGAGIWVPVFSKMNVNGVRSIMNAPDGSMLLSSEKGIFKSNDKGVNWRKVCSEIGVFKITLGDGVLIGATNKGLIRSTDSGEHWEFTLEEGRSIRQTKFAAGRFFAISSWTGTFKEVMANPALYGNRLIVSEDKGKTWRRIDENLTPIRFAITPEEGKMQAPSINDVEQVGESLFCSMDNGIFKSNDLGKTWKMVLPNSGRQSFRFAVSGNVIYAVLVFSGC